MPDNGHQPFSQLSCYIYNHDQKLFVKTSALSAWRFFRKHKFFFNSHCVSLINAPIHLRSIKYNACLDIFVVPNHILCIFLMSKQQHVLLCKPQHIVYSLHMAMHMVMFISKPHSQSCIYIYINSIYFPEIQNF